MTGPSGATFSQLIGDPHAVNAAMVASFTNSDNNTLITLTTGEAKTVREGFDVVAELLGAEGPTDC